MFNVILCSDWSKSSYPENNGGKFTNLLHHNLNFSREDWSVAISDIVYTPDTWASVRENYNDVVIRMKGFKKWGIAEYTLWCARPAVYDIVEAKTTITLSRDVGEACGEQIVSYKSEWMPINRPVFKDRADVEFTPAHWSKNACNKYHLDITYKELPYTIWCAKWPIYDITGSECMVRIGRRPMDGRKCLDYTSYFTSEPMQIVKPMFRAQVSANREFEPATWHKDKCNTFRVDMVAAGPIPVDHWEYETAYVPTGFYASFKDFAAAFDATILAAIMKIFDRVHAHPLTLNIPKYTPESYRKKFELPGVDWLVSKYLYNENNNVDTLKVVNAVFNPLDIAIDVVKEGEFKNIMSKNEPGKEYHLTLKDADKIWVSLTAYERKNAPDVAALSIVEEFATDTNFSMKINRQMQHQLGFTLSPIHDMGWVRWYPRKKSLETTIIPSLYWHGDISHDFTKNPLKSINVHCDIIEGSYIGKWQAPLLRIIPVNIFTHQISSESLAVLQYKHINKNNVSAITIWIAETPGGDPLELRSTVYVKLHFLRNG